MGRTAVHISICRRDYFLRLFLCVDRLQPQRGCRQYAEVWRIYSRHPAREAHRRSHQRNPDSHHAVGALYLIIISFIPEWMITGIHLNHLYGPIGAFFERLPTWMTNGLGVSFYFGGTSLLIVVGVAMDTVTQIEAQLIMRHYDGFTPRSGRIRGRRSWT